MHICPSCQAKEIMHHSSNLSHAIPTYNLGSMMTIITRKQFNLCHRKLFLEELHNKHVKVHKDID